MEKVIIIFGPTGIGKSKVGIELAKKINGEIISCDSMQIYKNLDIGTAKLKNEEMDGIKHHLLDFVDPFEEFSVGQYVKYVKNTINEILSRNKVPIVVGGTGLYISALINNYDFFNVEKNDELRNKYENILNEKGKEYLYNILIKLDSKRAKEINVNDTKRIIRALEINDCKKDNIKTNKVGKNYEFIIFGLHEDREKLYENINLRTEKMFQEGLIQEINKLKEMGLNLNNQSMQGIGYKEVIQGMNEGRSIEEIKEIIKRKTRNYAKRQMTYMRGIKNLIWIEKENACKKIIEVLNDKHN